MQPEFFDSIHIVIPHKEILSRLGYRSSTTKLKNNQLKKLQSDIEEACSFIDLKGAVLRLPIKEKKVTITTVGKDIVFESRLFASVLKNCNEVLFMGVTAGSGIMEQIGLLQEKDLSTCAVYDAVASEMTDACFNWLKSYYAHKLSPENKQLLPKRISAGFGDFSLINQKRLYELLNLERLGVTITKTYMLVPEKSATAVTGIFERKP
ncbi:MAG: hypothetical protein PHQ96_03690 [Candidatus Omnitrophica bacterium]|nr:hypothetical protein [Candidatus Omnitrophota bacterium]